MAFNKLIKDIAQALVAEALEAGKTPEIIADAQTLEAAFASDNSLVLALADPAMPEDKRRQALQTAFKGSINPLLINAIVMLQSAKLLKHYDQFSATLLETAEELANHREVRVISPLGLEKKELEDLAAVLQSKFGGTQRIHETVDPNILGGLIIKVGDWTYDASLKSKILRLKQSLSST